MVPLMMTLSGEDIKIDVDIDRVYICHLSIYQSIYVIIVLVDWVE